MCRLGRFPCGGVLPSRRDSMNPPRRRRAQLPFIILPRSLRIAFSRSVAQDYSIWPGMAAPGNGFRGLKAFRKAKRDIRPRQIHYRGFTVRMKFEFGRGNANWIPLFSPFVTELFCSPTFLRTNVSCHGHRVIAKTDRFV